MISFSQEKRYCHVFFNRFWIYIRKSPYTLLSLEELFPQQKNLEKLGHWSHESTQKDKDL